MINLSEIWGAIQDRVVELIHRTEARGCRVYRSTTQSISASTLTAISFDTEQFDTDDCYAAGSPTRMTVQRDGYYQMGGAYSFEAAVNTGACRMLVAIRLNGTTLIGANEVHTIANLAVRVSVATGMYWLAEGDYIEVMVLHTGSGARNISAVSTNNEHYNNGWLVRVS